MNSSTVITAPDGHEGLQRLGLAGGQVEGLPNLSLIKLHCHPISGFDLLRAIRTDDNTASLNAIAMLETDNEQDVSRALECGASSCMLIPKNFMEARKAFAEMWRGI